MFYQRLLSVETELLLAKNVSFNFIDFTFIHFPPPFPACSSKVSGDGTLGRQEGHLLKGRRLTNSLVRKKRRTIVHTVMFKFKVASLLGFYYHKTSSRNLV